MFAADVFLNFLRLFNVEMGVYPVEKRPDASMFLALGVVAIEFEDLISVPSSDKLTFQARRCFFEWCVRPEAPFDCCSRFSLQT